MATTRTGLLYGTGALRAAARGERLMWALHRAALMNGIVPVVPAMAVAEGFRTEARGDRLAHLLEGSEVAPLDLHAARHAGELAAKIASTDLLAAALADIAVQRNCAVVASRQNALTAAARLLGHRLVLYAV